MYWTERKCIARKRCVDASQVHVLLFDDDGLHIEREICDACGDCEMACPSTALSMYGQWWDVEELFHEIEKEKVFFDKAKGGITVSGGESTLQPDFLLKVLKICKENGISTALDTYGY